MIKDFFIKKENIFIIVVGIISIFFVVLGFLFLFFQTDNSNSARIIPSTIEQITWTDFRSKLLDQKIFYPEYMFIGDQKEGAGDAVVLAEFEPREFLNYFSNQNHVSFYPNGLGFPLLYGKTKISEYTSKTGQKYERTEYLTLSNQVWAVVLVPEKSFYNWQSWGFVWLQSQIQNRIQKCITDTDTIIEGQECDSFTGQKVVYDGTVSEKFIQTGYEIINKNTFK